MAFQALAHLACQLKAFPPPILKLSTVFALYRSHTALSMARRWTMRGTVVQVGHVLGPLSHIKPKHGLDEKSNPDSMKCHSIDVR